MQVNSSSFICIQSYYGEQERERERERERIVDRIAPGCHGLLSSKARPSAPIIVSLCVCVCVSVCVGIPLYVYMCHPLHTSRQVPSLPQRSASVATVELGAGVHTHGGGPSDKCISSSQAERSAQESETI